MLGVIVGVIVGVMRGNPPPVHGPGPPFTPSSPFHITLLISSPLPEPSSSTSTDTSTRYRTGACSAYSLYIVIAFNPSGKNETHLVVRDIVA